MTAWRGGSGDRELVRGRPREGDIVSLTSLSARTENVVGSILTFSSISLGD